MAITQRALSPVLGDSIGALMASGEQPLPPDHRAVPESTRRVRSISFVIPAKNEAATLRDVVLGVGRIARSLEVDFEVVVVDDGSTDGTAEAVGSLAEVRVLRHGESLGNGAAIKRGIRAARCDWVVLMDADGQHPPDAVASLARMAERFDMVVGSRGGAGGVWYRNLANRIYNRLASYVTSRDIPDLTSGFRMVRADVAKSLVYLLPNTFSYPTTITLAMLRCGYSVGFQPFAVRERVGRSHIRVLRDGTRFLLIICKIATFFAPLRVFMPISLAMAAAGVGWYLHTFLAEGRFTNMSALLLTQATVVFVLGLVSEQVAALRFERVEERQS